MRHIGLFLEELREGATDAEFFRELLDTVDAAEAWGLDGIWLGEIHFLPSRSILSSPLMVAAAKGHVTTAQRLLAHGANPGLSTDDGTTALLLALQNGHAAVAFALLGGGADKDG